MAGLHDGEKSEIVHAFDQAALRHWQDSQLLERNHRLSNANHHVGFAAECAIKSALVTIGACLNDGELAGKYRHHIQDLWDRAQVQGLHLRFPGLSALLKADNPFSDWHEAYRYAGDEAVDAQMHDRHREQARRLLGVIGLNGQRGG